jgi:hypothetical protein
MMMMMMWRKRYCLIKVGRDTEFNHYVCLEAEIRTEQLRNTSSWLEYRGITTTKFAYFSKICDHTNTDWRLCPATLLLLIVET